MNKSIQKTINSVRPSRLEKVPAAAGRMGISVSQIYREIKAGRLTLVKLGIRASAIPSASVDAWIEARIAESQTASRVGR